MKALKLILVFGAVLIPIVLVLNLNTAAQQTVEPPCPPYPGTTYYCTCGNKYDLNGNLLEAGTEPIYGCQPHPTSPAPDIDYPTNADPVDEPIPQDMVGK